MTGGGSKEKTAGITGVSEGVSVRENWYENRKRGPPMSWRRSNDSLLGTENSEELRVLYHRCAVNRAAISL